MLVFLLCIRERKTMKLFIAHTALLFTSLWRASERARENSVAQNTLRIANQPRRHDVRIVCTTTLLYLLIFLTFSHSRSLTARVCLRKLWLLEQLTRYQLENIKWANDERWEMMATTFIDLCTEKKTFFFGAAPHELKLTARKPQSRLNENIKKKCLILSYSLHHHAPLVGCRCVSVCIFCWAFRAIRERERVASERERRELNAVEIRVK
jgi:hypothetical protein